jgi:hypothetical protein
VSPWVLLLTLCGTESLGPPLRQDGFQVRPPRAFRMARMALFEGTRAGVVTLAPAGGRTLSAALLDGEGEDAASMVIAVVDAPFSLSPSARDEVSTAVLRHFRDELGLPFVLEGAGVEGGSAPRVEVLGSIREGSQLRRILAVAFPGESRHAVVLFSVPSGRWDEARPTLEASLGTFRLDASPPGLSRQWRLALVGLTASLLVLSFGLWKWRGAREASA